MINLVVNNFVYFVLFGEYLEEIMRNLVLNLYRLARNFFVLGNDLFGRVSKLAQPLILIDAVAC